MVLLSESAFMVIGCEPDPCMCDMTAIPCPELNVMLPIPLLAFLQAILSAPVCWGLTIVIYVGMSVIIARC